jgi:hypothetical protein
LQANAENKAVAHLARQDLRHIAALLNVEGSPASTPSRRLCSPLPFVEINMAAQRWRSIYSTVGVAARL